MQETTQPVREPMLDYLSGAWLAALDEAVRSDADLARATVGCDLVIEQVVELTSPTEGGGPASIVWQVRLLDGRPEVVVGSDGDATVRFTTDLATAESITRGLEPAQAAFLRGDLRIGGDTAALAERRELLASVADVAASLRHRTRFPSDGAGA